METSLKCRVVNMLQTFIWKKTVHHFYDCCSMFSCRREENTITHEKKNPRYPRDIYQIRSRPLSLHRGPAQDILLSGLQPSTWPAGTTCPQCSTASTWCRSSESKLHSKHRLDEVVFNQTDRVQSLQRAFECPISIFMCRPAHPGGWHLLCKLGPHGGPLAQSWWSEQRGLKKKEARKGGGGGEKEREMSFKWHPHCEAEQDDGTLQNC